MITLAALYVYPVKSCRGIALERAQVTQAGLKHDREWMVVTPTGRFLTQRELPRLAVVVPQLADGCLRLSAPDVADLEVSVTNAPDDTRQREVVVWGQKCLGRDEGDTAARWFSGVLGRDVRLVRFDPARPRPTEPEWSEGLDGRALFSDGYPLLVLSRASLDDLNARLPAPLPVDRFRPNVLLDGCEPYGEDRITALESGDVRLRLVKPCTRCVITTTNQSTGVVEGDEPLKTLKTYRFDKKLRGVAFAMNTIVERGDGASLRVGDVLEATLR